MNSENLISGQDISDHLHRNGYILLPGWRREETTVAIGRSIGKVVDVQALLPQSAIPIVQTLEPRYKADSLSTRYSGTYGLSEFPLHTDLAHWMRPPRYLLLRCRRGKRAVTTRLLTSSALASVLGIAILHRALLRPRRSGRNGMLCLLPLVFYSENICGFRWDSLFLVPMNEAASEVGGQQRRLAEFGSRS